MVIILSPYRGENIKMGTKLHRRCLSKLLYLGSLNYLNMKINKIKYLFVFFIIPLVFTRAQDGLVRSYYENKHMESAVYYANGVLNGTARWFYENGVMKEEKNYLMGKLNGWYKTWYNNSAPKLEVFIKDGRRDGIAKEYYINGGLKTVYVYDDGVLKEKRDYEYDNTLPVPVPDGKTNDFLMKGYVAPKTADKSEADKLLTGKQGGSSGNGDMYLIVAEEYPKPLGGLQEIQNRLKKPENVKNKLTGVVVVRAFIDDHGYVTKTEIVKSLAKEYDEAAAEAVGKTAFQPGKLEGKPVNVQITVPVSF